MKSSHMGQVAWQAKIATNLCVPRAFMLRFMLISGIIYDDVIETLNPNKKNGKIFLYFTWTQFTISTKINFNKPCTQDLQCSLHYMFKLFY